MVPKTPSLFLCNEAQIKLSILHHHHSKRMDADIKEQLTKLTNQVQKNSKAIAQTGQLVLDLQLQDQRRDIAQLSLKDSELKQDAGLVGNIESKASKKEHISESITQDDIVELVNELQGQLDILDERSVRRTSNAFVADDKDLIAPIPGRDGQYPSDAEKFPKNLREFKDLDDVTLEYWLRWYELLPPDENELAQIFGKLGTSMEELGVEKPKSKGLTQEEADERYDTLARFIGLRNRRTPGVW